MARHWIGTSGWSYDHWQGIAYPENTPVKDRLAYYVRLFDTVEANNTFYHWPRRASFAHWRDRLPEGFVFTAKASRVLSHRLKLLRPEKSLAYMEEGLRELGDRRGPLLVQTPPDFAFDLPRLEYFLSCLPKDQRTAMELRHESWNREETFEALERHGAAYCVMSGAHLPCVLRATTDFVYVRLHGPDTEHLYGGSYSEEDLRWWAARVREWEADGRDVCAYFNNDGYGNAVYNAKRLNELLG
jgi:uncharacterized protein YecE (DUF72 family)